MRHAMLLLAITACTTLETADTSAPITLGEANAITLSSGSNHDLNSNSCNYSYSICHLIGDAGGSTLTGLNPGGGVSYGDALYLRNSGSAPIVLAHDTGSASGRRFLLPGGVNINLTAGRSVLVYKTRDWSSEPPSFEGWRVLDDRGYFGVESTSTPTRVLGTAFQPSATRDTLVTYSASADCTITVSGGQEGRVEFLSDSANPPTTIRADIAGCKNTGTVAIGVSQVMGDRGSVSYTVPAGDFALIRSVNVTGTPTYAITRQTEQTR